MPPLKQPTPLEDRAMEVLVDFFSSFCEDCRDDMDKLRRGIPFIRNKKGSEIPPKLTAEFYNRVLNEIDEWPSLLTDDDRIGDEEIFVNETLVRIGKEILLDETIVGLDCPLEILNSLQPGEVNRIRGITRLELNDRLPYSLDNIHLEHLTVFEYRSECTNSDLQLISANCPKLEHVDVRLSEAVTDIGLHALASCPDLQFVALTGCVNVSTIAVSHFLSVKRTIRHLFAWPDSHLHTPGFDFREVPNWEADLSVYESLESFTIVDDFSQRHLLHIMTRFPNLRSINIWENLTLDLSSIKSLSKLSKIEFDVGDGSTWANFESLLKFIGPQIEQWVVHSENFNTMLRGFDSIFRFCENLEDLDFRCGDVSEVSEVKLVVPPFAELNKFRCDDTHELKLEFGELPQLEDILWVCGFDVGLSQIESIILDHNNFPNLKKICVNYCWDLDYVDLNRLKDILKTNNLDLTIL